MSNKSTPLPQEPVRSALSLGWPKTLLLGFQHLFAMFGATVLVPIITGLSIQTTLFCAGCGTLLFHVICKGSVPAFLGSSFAFLGGFEIVKSLDTGVFAGLTTEEKLPYACGGIVVAGLLYLVMSALVKAVGIKRVMRFLPPVVTGPIIILIGLTLAPVAVNSASSNYPLAFLAIAVIIICNIWGKGMIKIIPILLGVAIPYCVALALNLVDFSGMAAVKAVAPPPFTLAKFDISAILVMAPIALASMMEHIGDISAISATVGKDFISKPGLHRTLLGDGLATSLAALIGGPANTTYGENTGVLVLSRVYDPLVIQLAAVFAILLSCFPKISVFISVIPPAIIGGVSFVLYGMISAVGVRNVVENKVDFTNTRNLIIAAVILVCGLGFTGNNVLTFSVMGTSITLTGLAVAAIAGIGLNAILPGNDYQFGADLQGDTSVSFELGNK